MTALGIILASIGAILLSLMVQTEILKNSKIVIFIFTIIGIIAIFSGATFICKDIEKDNYIKQVQTGEHPVYTHKIYYDSLGVPVDTVYFVK